jgi:nicotinate-nucleotide--dimethylbenzimidazole phosphoribosyltransferase
VPPGGDSVLEPDGDSVPGWVGDWGTVGVVAPDAPVLEVVPPLGGRVPIAVAPPVVAPVPVPAEPMPVEPPAVELVPVEPVPVEPGPELGLVPAPDPEAPEELVPVLRPAPTQPVPPDPPALDEEPPPAPAVGPLVDETVTSPDPDVADPSA